MLTSQDIREKTFEKAVFGGYDMGAVDEFLEEVSTDLAALQKENATLKGKMKVLVDKIEEYRGNEEAMRMAILSAQKMGLVIEKEAKENSEQMVSDAKLRSEQMVNEAMADAARITKEATLELDVEKARLEEARRSSAQFIENMGLLCRKQMDFLTRLQDSDFVKSFLDANKAPAPAQVEEAPAPAEEESVSPQEIHETVKSIEETIAKAASEPVSDVRPEIRDILSAGEDSSPTRSFDIISSDAGKNEEPDFDVTSIFK